MRSIGLVEDHFATTMGIAALLGQTPDLRLAAHARTVPELLAQTPRHDLVLLDLSLSDRSEPEDNVRRLAAAGFPALAFTSGDNPYLIRSAARGGVLGMVRKSAAPGELLGCIRSALGNGVEQLTSDWASALDADPSLDEVGLSERQREVLELFACGQSARAVAEQTGLSVTTVQDYLLRIKTKYAQRGRPVTSKIDLYKRAVEDGLLPPPNQSG